VTLEIADIPDALAPLDGQEIVVPWQLDFRDPDAASRLAERRIAVLDGALAAVVSFRELGVQSAAVAAERVHLAWNSAKAITTVRRKDLTRASLRRAGLPQPVSRAFTACEEAIDFLEKEPGRWVVKPSHSLGSQGVSVVASADQADQAVCAAARFGWPILVEEQVSGEEFSAEGLFVAGHPHIVALTRKQLGPEPYFVSIGHVMPAELDPSLETRVRDAVIAALSAVGLTHSLFHAEFWVTPAAEVIIGEVHARPGGDWIHRLVEEVHGIDLFDAALAELVGDPVGTLVTNDVAAAATAAVVADKAGVLREITGVEAVRSDPRCVVLDIKAQVGLSYSRPTSHYDRLALVVARGADADAAAQAANELAGRLVPIFDVNSEDNPDKE